MNSQRGAHNTGPGNADNINKNNGAIPKHNQNRRNKRSTEGNKKTRNDTPNRSYNNRYNIRGAGSNDHQQKQHGAKYYLGFKKLEKLTTEKPEDVLIGLKHEMGNLISLFNENLSGDYIVLIIKLLLKLTEATFNEVKMQMILIVLHENFMKQLTNFILGLAIADSADKNNDRYFWDNPNEFFKVLLITCTAILDLMPNKSFDRLSKVVKAVSKILIDLEETGTAITDETKGLLRLTKVKIDAINTEIERKNFLQLKTVEDGNDDENDLEPPESFRNLLIIPTVAELLAHEPPFLRKNRIEGAYRDPIHYLDIQFRLLKEDFAGPLRGGIQKYMEHKTGKIENIRVHKTVQFISKYCDKSTIGILLQFSTSKKCTINENSKRFIYGSLLCFTDDNFTNMSFGKVIERNEHLLKKGQVVVDLFDNYKPIEYNKSYIMVECNIFFEPYYQVLTALQTFNENNFPLENYLLYIDKLPKLPNYFNKDDGSLNQILIRRRKYDIDDENSWPIASALGLNDSQFIAYKHALTREFVVIQGPPGTGKTFLGLKIAETLLENQRLWHKAGPMLVVCYTNHALDQFLEGMIRFTHSIIRVGGQSKSERLKELNILNQRKGKASQAMGRVFYNERNQLNSVLEKINRCSAFIKALDQYDGIIRIKQINNLDPEVAHSKIAAIASINLAVWLSNDTRVSAIGGYNDVSILAQDMSYDDSDLENVLDFDDLLTDYVQEKPYWLSLIDINQAINNAKLSISKISEEEYTTNLKAQCSYYMLTATIKGLYDLHDRIQYNLNRGKEQQFHEKPRDWMMYDHKTMPVHMRWHMYFYLLNQYKLALERSLVDLYDEHKVCLKRYNEVRNMMDLDIMQNTAVIGMTTTGAARMQATLKALRCPIVIVEEAAEVLESHIVVCLSKECNQLILIGDHQQLRPSTSNFNLEVNYGLGLSMFERMIINKMDCDTLNVQHRMRPEISALICPAIYPNLINATSVYGYPNVKGVTKSLYFIDHNNPETNEEDSMSRKNQFEVEYLLALAKYIILNGYKAADITIVAAYSAQMFSLRNLRKNESLLKEVNITVLDNYQGEENKIILLSLVRNINSESIGFLRIENRVCVALSRAKEGMYIMGNMELLCRYGKIWQKIKEVLVKQDSLGPALPLYCQLHDVTTNIGIVNDFEQVPEGGCNRLCATELICGHRCKKICHPYDRDHTQMLCSELCAKILCDLNHQCPDICGKICDPCKVLVLKTLACGHDANIECHIAIEDYKCMVLLQKTLPCEHVVDVPCSSNPKDFRCPIKCDSRVEPCGHSCTLTCHKLEDPDHIAYLCNKPCEQIRIGCKEGNHVCSKLCHEDCEPCDYTVKRQRTVCPHVYEIPCKDDVDFLKCEKPCKRIMECGHKCKNACFKECGPCEVKVVKTVEECGHKIRVECKTPARKLYCKGKCPLLLPCGHQCQNKCNEACTRKCSILSKILSNAPCGHMFKIPCSSINMNMSDDSVREILKYCNEPCGATLNCSHKCRSTCGECYQGRVHKACDEKCGIILPCGHECTSPCREVCRPCQQKCSYKCKHSRCTRKCGEPCTPCVEKCPRQCEHVRCTKKCGEFCDVPACTEPCEKELKCGHSCIGFCGDACSPLCRICNAEELDEFILGYEDEDSRYVYLVDCGHTIESAGMDRWLNVQNADNHDAIEIKAACCPRCKTVVTSTQRYNDYVKHTCADLMLIKKKHHGDLKKNHHSLLLVLEKYHTLLEAYKPTIVEYDDLRKLTDFLKRLTSPVTKEKKRQPMDKMKIDTIKAKIDLLEETLKILKQFKIMTSESIMHTRWFMQFFCAILMRNDNLITGQEIRDINMEILKFNRVIQYLQVKQSLTEYQRGSKEVSTIMGIFDHFVCSIERYTDESDLKYKNYLINLNESCKSGLNITDCERKEILKAMGLRSGHWYKCRNGHIYCITECGGAMQVSTCNECGVQIGGTNHSLLTDNQLATEMDGARHAAWSEQANLLNYNF